MSCLEESKDKKESKQNTVIEKDSKVNTKNEKKNPKSEITKTDENSEDEEDSWEKHYDDHGNCLDADATKELSLAVGKVTIQKPVFDYDDLKSKFLTFFGFFDLFFPSIATDCNLGDKDCSHLIEIYDFPPTANAGDIINVFREYLKRGFDLRWVDETHAIGVFTCKETAMNALKQNRGLVKTRPMSQASQQTKQKVRQCPDLFEPYQ